MRIAKCRRHTPYASSAVACSCAHFAICILQFAFQVSLERLSERDEPGRATFTRLGIDLEAEVEPDRPDRRPVPQAEPGRTPQLPQIDVGGVGEHVPAVDESHT